jgi:predicted nucleotidyltransferase
MSILNHSHVVDAPQLAAFCEKYHIRKLALFGSILRDDFSAASDVDVLVEFDTGHTPDFFRLYQLEEELSALFEGRRIDLVTYKALNRHLRDDVLAKAVVQYESVATLNLGSIV